MKRAIALLVAIVTAVVVWNAVAGAQGAIEVRESSARSEFPNGLFFTLDATVSGQLDDIRLLYQVAPDGVRATAPPECAGGTVISCTFQLDASRRNVLIPGAEVTYYWRLTVDGVTQETEPQLVTYGDDRFDWHTVRDGNLTV